ncbi:MAG: polyphosphate kinase [Bacteroidetes bacterium]|jgi:polyphosphate kinase|nr:polyphosphate kinase [Bacteroidota bacterium]
MPKKHLPYINREIAWLSFNDRVLQEAEDASTPLIERVKFLGIYSNNRDEFYRVRVATVKRLSKIGKRAVPLIGEDPNELLGIIQKRVLEQQKKFESIYQNILKELKKNNIFIIDETQLDREQQTFVKDYFHNELVSNLFPIMIDENTSFPYLNDKSSYLFTKLVAIDGSKKIKYAVIEVPTKNISRFVVLPAKQNKQFIILLDDVMRFCLDEIFEIFGLRATEAYNIKLTRDAEMDLDKDLSQSLLDKVSEGIKNRKKGNPVRLVYDGSMSKDMLSFMMRKLNFTKKDAPIPGGRYHNFKDFINFPKLGRKDLVYNHRRTLHNKYLVDAKQSVIKAVKQRDILLYYPYQSFDHIIALLREASIEPTVESIKITLYRVADSSKIANALINAIKNGKQVMVVVELQARFDEENNIYWANKLNEEGATVIYGVPRLKVHSKLFLITMREKGKETRIAHVGTGNFNEKTAKIYTDAALLTADNRITEEVSQVFNFFNDNFRIGNYKNLAVSPFNMRKSLVGLIVREIQNAKEGKTAYMIIKVNNLVDREMVLKLYEASQAGVKIKLIVRGSCSIACGVPGVSDNIEGISIVDKFLEHSRIFVFANGGQERIFISSADWMTRNLDQRCEVAVPIYSKEIQQQLRDILNIQLKGNIKARVLDETLSNRYKKPVGREKPLRAQDAVYDYFLKDKLSYLKTLEEK